MSQTTKVRGRNHSEDLCVDKIIILKPTLRNRERVSENNSKDMTLDVSFEYRKEISGHKKGRISLLVKWVQLINRLWTADYSEAFYEHRLTDLQPERRVSAHCRMQKHYCNVVLGAEMRAFVKSFPLHYTLYKRTFILHRVLVGFQKIYETVFDTMA